MSYSKGYFFRKIKSIIWISEGEWLIFKVGGRCGGGGVDC